MPPIKGGFLAQNSPDKGSLVGKLSQARIGLAENGSQEGSL